jgi:hypothetical protein
VGFPGWGQQVGLNYVSITLERGEATAINVPLHCMAAALAAAVANAVSQSRCYCRRRGVVGGGGGGGGGEDVGCRRAATAWRCAMVRRCS